MDPTQSQPSNQSQQPTVQLVSQNIGNTQTPQSDPPANVNPAPAVNQTGTRLKEQAPVVSTAEETYVQLAEQSPTLSVEVQAAGVEVASDNQPQLTQELQQITGMQPAKDAVPVKTAPTGVVQLPALPFDEIQAQQTLKKTAKNESVHWLAMLVKFVIRQLKVAQKNSL